MEILFISLIQLLVNHCGVSYNLLPLINVLILFLPIVSLISLFISPGISCSASFFFNSS